MQKRASISLVAVAVTMGVTTNERLERLASLDLSNVRRKLMEPEPEGKGWSEEQALEAEKWYKRYLASIICFPDATSHVPNGPIDFFWHQHILDTMAYGQDMEYVMGYFLHHYPYFGLNGDAEERDDAFDVTNVIYRHMFGEDCLSMKTFGFGNAAYCGNGGDVSCQKVGKNFKNGIDLLPPVKGEEDGRIIRPNGGRVVKGQNCGHKGGGTGCGQGCSRKRTPVTRGMGCDHAGSGTGCGQGGRGGHRPERRTEKM